MILLMQHHGRDLHYIALLDEWNIVVSKRYDEVTELFDYPMYNLPNNKTKISSLSMLNDSQSLIRIEESDPRLTVKKCRHSYISALTTIVKWNSLI
jgi:hypothetical protein